jgi:hypothetical protein
MSSVKALQYSYTPSESGMQWEVVTPIQVYGTYHEIGIGLSSALFWDITQR